MTADNTYDNEFYTTLNKSSEVAADIYIEYLFKYFRPGSVADIGCGHAAWLKASKKYGSSKHTGVDGIWNDGKLIQELGFKFVCKNLDIMDESIEQHDLAISLEVAEHLKPESSDVILFSAAFTNQGGTNHINERNPSFWGNLFSERDYVAFDLFREKFWGDERVGFWYRQNCFLYCKKGSPHYYELIKQNIRVVENLDFLDCVHPSLFMTKCGEGIGFLAHARGIVPSLFKAVARVIKKK